MCGGDCADGADRLILQVLTETFQGLAVNRLQQPIQVEVRHLPLENL